MMVNYSEWHTERAPQGKKVNSVEETSSLSDKIQILKQEWKEATNKAKYFWIFQISNQKQQVKQTKARKLKRQTKRNNGNIFWSFCVLESRNKNENNKEKKAKHGYTKYRQNTIYR
jgi:hypothetical protein